MRRKQGKQGVGGERGVVEREGGGSREKLGGGCQTLYILKRRERKSMEVKERGCLACLEEAI